MKMMCKVTATVLLCAPLLSWADCNGFDAYGTPIGTPLKGDIQICHTGYMVGYSKTNREPDWTLYKTTGEKTALSCKKQPNFRPDPTLAPKYQLSNADYKNNNQDKGHFSPRASMDFTCKSEKESVYYTNAAPQRDKLNQVGWRALEENIRDYFESTPKEQYFILTGQKRGTKVIPGTHATIPQKYYKVIYVPDRKQTIAFMYDNAPLGTHELAKGVMSVAQLEKELNIKTFNIPESQKDHVGTMFKKIYQ